MKRRLIRPRAPVKPRKKYRAKRQPVEARPSQAGELDLMAAAARATAQAYDEVFALRRKVAQVREQGRAEAEAHIDELRNRIAELNEELERTRAEYQPSLDAERQRADHFEAWSNALLSSTSWKITAPLRALVNRLRR